MRWPPSVWWRGRQAFGIYDAAVMERAWKYALMRKFSWKERKGPWSSVRLQLDDLETEWPGYDVKVSPDNRHMNLNETCPDDVKHMIIKGSRESERERERERKKERLFGKSGHRSIDFKR